MEIISQGARKAYNKALEGGSKSVQRTRLMLVGQGRVGKTSLMRNLTHQSFNSEETSTEGIDTATQCSLNVTHAEGWELRGESDDRAGLRSEFVESMAAEMDPQTRSFSSSKMRAEKLRRQAAEDMQRQTAREEKSVSRTSFFSFDPEIARALERKQEVFMEVGQIKDEKVSLSIWDFAGQDLYYTTHQTFLSSRAVYVVVFNLSHDLEKPIPETGTASINKIFTRIRKEIINKPYLEYIVTYFYAIENSLGHSNEKIGKLRRHINEIASKEPYMGEKIPLRWLQFDKDKLKGGYKSTDHDGTPVFSLNEVRVNSGVDSHAELQTMLTFYHDLGHIVYFGREKDGKNQELKDVVILDPQWLIDAFKKVITVMPPQEQMSGLTKSWQRLQEEGILVDELIDHMWVKFPKQKKTLLCLMDKFDLLCERIDQDNDNVSYYVPSMLQKQTSESSKPPSHEIANHFVVDFESFLPDGLFHRLVVRALRWSQNFGGTDPSLDYHQGRFFIDEQHEFVLQMERKNDLAYIQVSVILVPELGYYEEEKEAKMKRRKTASPEVTKKVLEFVKDELEKLKDRWIKRINYSFAVQCTCGHESIHFLPLDECLGKTGIVCRANKKQQLMIKTLQFKAMFEEISSAQDLKHTVDREPMSEIHLDLIAADLGQKWERLAIHLGFEQSDIDKFKADSINNTHGQIFSMLREWKQNQQQSVPGIINELVKALEVLKLGELAKKVQTWG